jgi:hypothetical protein
MLTYIYQLLKNRRANQLLARIARTDPAWVANPTAGTKRNILDYLIHSLSSHAQQSMEDWERRRKATDAEAPNDFPDSPVLSPIVEACLDFWADESGSVYARRWIEREISIGLYQQRVEQCENLITHYHKLVESCQQEGDFVRQQKETIKELAKEAERIIDRAKSITESMTVDKRMN